MKCVLVTGGRDYANRRSVFDTLDVLKPDVLIEGGAAGADALARAWATERGVQPATFSANWNKLGKPAGPIRNAMMVTVLKALEKAGWECKVVAFSGGRGTANCTMTAEESGFVVEKVK